MPIPAVDRMAVVAGRDPLEGRMRVLPHLVGPGRRPRLGVMAALADSITGVHAFDIAGDGTPLTADLSVHATGAPVEPGEDLFATSDVLRWRRSGAVFGVEVRRTAAPDQLVATGMVTYTIVQGLPAYRPEPHVGEWPRADLPTSMADAVPVSVGATGHLEVQVDDDTRNSVGLLSGGVILLASDLACEHAARTASGCAVEVVDLQAHFLAPGRAEAVRFETECSWHGLLGLVRVRAVGLGEGAGEGPIAAATGRVRLVEEAVVGG
jgi:acyl-coenzyme A thioesterase PaaI-like protein